MLAKKRENRSGIQHVVDTGVRYSKPSTVSNPIRIKASRSMNLKSFIVKRAIKICFKGYKSFKGSCKPQFSILSLNWV